MERPSAIFLDGMRKFYAIFFFSYIRPLTHCAETSDNISPIAATTEECERSLLSSMSSCGFRRIPSGKSEFHGIPWNFYGKHLAGASAIWVSISMEIPTFFQGIPMEMVGMREPPGMIPNGIHGIPLEFH